MKFKILRQELSTRGGGIEIDLTPFGYKGQKMAAYQNYLGGGMLGKICVNDTIQSRGDVFVCPDSEKELCEIGEELKKYFHSLTNPEEGWESMSYEQNQKLSEGAY
jgi:hypothetical protein